MRSPRAAENSSRTLTLGLTVHSTQWNCIPLIFLRSSIQADLPFSLREPRFPESATILAATVEGNIRADHVDPSGSANVDDKSNWCIEITHFRWKAGDKLAGRSSAGNFEPTILRTVGRAGAKIVRRSATRRLEELTRETSGNSRAKLHWRADQRERAEDRGTQ